MQIVSFAWGLLKCLSNLLNLNELWSVRNCSKWDLLKCLSSMLSLNELWSVRNCLVKVNMLNWTYMIHITRNKPCAIWEQRRSRSAVHLQFNEGLLFLSIYFTESIDSVSRQMKALTWLQKYASCFEPSLSTYCIKVIFVAPALAWAT